ncbi:hypothetical protein LJC07_03945 [Christensenellaceae bacterium OttesenSCG-928-L17]|nr:hypothetical protein [Christensenellaceae bacterium OttesenSCG-928-L17]
MTDTAKLLEIIDKSGYKKNHIAQELGITRYALMKKVNNVTEFKASEIGVLSEILNIKDKEDIFFTS